MSEEKIILILAGFSIIFSISGIAYLKHITKKIKEENQYLIDTFSGIRK